MGPPKMERAFGGESLLEQRNYKTKDEGGLRVGSGKRARLGVTRWGGLGCSQQVHLKDFSAELTFYCLQKVGLWGSSFSTPK